MSKSPSTNTNPLALAYSRLAMATLTPQNFEVAKDGAFYDPQMYRLFCEFEEKVKANAS